MSHHASGPNFGFPRGDARLDMTDLYAFSKPGDPGKTILILNVHPSFKLDSPEPTTKEPFAPGALYEIKIDTDGDAIADLCYSVQFASSEPGKETATVRRTRGAHAAGFGSDGEVLVQGARISVGREALVTEAGDFRFFFGWRSDPFFFDAMGNFNHMQFTGDDFFTTKDICGIVLEIPNSELGSNEVGIWARTVEKTWEGWVQADRGGRPLQAVFLVGEEREAYLSGEPVDDDRFISVFAHELEHSGGYSPADAKAVARKLLPDILSYRPNEPVCFPHNGRTLTDDVVDVFFSIYANRDVTDKVGPHRDLLNEFPYLGPPHNVLDNRREESMSAVKLDDARRVISAAEKKAREIGQPMNIAVADEGGNLVAHIRMDNAWFGSIDIAIKKAYTSRAFDIETKELAKHAQSGGQFFGVHASNDGKVMIFAGGVPLRRGGKVVGAIGVSGGSGDQDQAVAAAGAAAF
jgi:uncharacterized protein GlcG (DUF336 family)